MSLFDFLRRRERISSISDIVEELRVSAHHNNRGFFLQEIPSRPAIFAEYPEKLSNAALAASTALGIEQPYSHQAKAIATALEGKDVAIATSTASGKSLCYHLPAISALADYQGATVLYLFPTKALSQDQLRSLNRMRELAPELRDVIFPGVYDGDTPPPARRKIRDSSNLIITNPEMLHQGILPNHVKWGRFLGNLRYIVLDELHNLRGIYGSHMALVLRRLLRVAVSHGATPSFICTSATIANPEELAVRLTGRQFTVITDDGSPRGTRYFAIINPPLIDKELGLRRSANIEAKEIFTGLIRSGIQTIAFCRTRMIAELVYRYAHEQLLSELGKRIAPYRAGYLPEERREIEQALFTGELMGVISTNALEMGIDIGSLDASIMIGYPGTVASLWQQAGRAGRREYDSLSILIAYDNPIDQYYFNEPSDLLGKPVEEAIIDPGNPYILAGHLRCAAKECPLTENDLVFFGKSAKAIAGALRDSGDFSERNSVFYWARDDYPAANLSLRTASQNTVNIVDVNDHNKVIGTIDEISALEQVHPEAIYIHEGETYYVRELDWPQRVALVEKKESEYYTQAMLEGGLAVLSTIEKEENPTHIKGLGDVKATWATIGFKKIRFGSTESLGWGTLQMPQQHIDTVGMWLIPNRQSLAKLTEQELQAAEAMTGVRNLMRASAPLLAMCDRNDISVVLDSSNFGSLTIFTYDYYIGGLGFSERLYLRLHELLERCLHLVSHCGCRRGCPSCVGSPLDKVAQFKDLDLGIKPPVPHKSGAKILLDILLY